MVHSRLAWLYLLTVALVWALGEFVGERTVPTLLLAYAPPLLWLLPAPLVLGWTLWRRRGVATALAGTLLAAGGAGLLHWRPQTDGALQVITFNVAQGLLGSPEEIAAALRAADADLLLLQETNFVRPGFRETLLARLPGYAVRDGYEVTTLSRLPVLSATNHAAPGTQRTFLETRVRWQGREVRVLNVHLGTVLVSSALRGDFDRVRQTRDVRTAQVARLSAIAEEGAGTEPLLLGGDLNTPPRGLAYRELRRASGPDAHSLAGRGPGWTFPGLFLRIDHLMARGLTPTRTRVFPESGSDHRALLAEYR
ncbi:endonuclease/exonuclease/phosphatase family protein [Deinococcus sp. MIMF12]|uniref:Endonuclease/exonuclease/phosphatase family protein n=1 Tax=Deinococcus rhizophilus TaxID=3049544 RepID=A0ABT7JDK4_9DEIO|nr:endonuclease/exonuclease/phosphatase family protein [Deinococcus rhizophilus]MDL2342632.1 endonuclease/exonuclease/phosphatase family protein [Deinococcus rhizophilus]